MTNANFVTKPEARVYSVVEVEEVMSLKKSFPGFKTYTDSISNPNARPAVYFTDKDGNILKFNDSYETNLENLLKPLRKYVGACSKFPDLLRNEEVEISKIIERIEEESDKDLQMVEGLNVGDNPRARYKRLEGELA